MKFDIDSDILTKALTFASYGISRKTLNPILKNYVFEVRKGCLNIITTKGIMTVAVRVPEVELEPMSYRVIFNAETLLQIAKTSRGIVSFDCAPRKAVLTSGKSEWVLQLEDATNFPEIKGLDISHWQEVSRVPFLEALNAVTAAVSTDYSKPALCAVNVTENTFIASDGTRLQRYRSDFAYPDFNLPSHSISEVNSLLKNTNTEFFGIRPAKNGVGIKIDNTTIIIGAKADEYPDVSSAILKPTLINEDVVELGKEELIQCMRRCKITTENSFRVLSIELRSGKLVLSSRNLKGSHSVEEIYTYWDDENTKIKANVNYFHLEAAVTSCPLANLMLVFGREENARMPSILLKTEDGQYTAVVSQVRTDLL